MPTPDLLAEHLLISEYSTDGAFSGGDFIELYNGTGVDIPVGDWDLHIYGADPAQWTTIPIASLWGNSIADGKHLLFARFGTLVSLTADVIFVDGLGPVTGIGIWDGSGYVDAVGNRARTHNGDYPAAGIFEGDGVPPLLQITGFDQSYERRNGGSAGNCVDDDNNATDFKRNILPGSPSPQGRFAEPVNCGEVPPPTEPPADHLVISEVRTDGAGGGADEFLEVFNPTAAAIPLGEYVVLDEGDVLEFEFPDIMLAPGDHYVIRGSNYTGDFDATYPGGGIQNRGAVKLAQGQFGPVVDEIELGDGPGSPKLPELNGRLDQSYQRIDGGCTDTDSASDFEVTLSSSPSTQGSNVARCAVGVDCAAAHAGSSNLRNADLTNCNLDGLDLTATEMPGANLVGAGLSGADLTGVNMTNAQMGGAVLVDTTLTDADLDGADLTGADLTRVRGNGAQFVNAIFDGAILTDASLTLAKFDEARFTGADLRGATLTQAELSKVNLTDANLDSAVLNDAKFDDATLVRTDLTNTQLQGANFDQTDLTEATFLFAVGTPGVDNAIFANTTCPNGSVSSGASCWP